MKKTSSGFDVHPGERAGFSRRKFLAGGGALFILGAAAGCGGGNSGGASEETSSGETVTIEHKYGQTGIEGVPQRIVSVGYTDQDPILAVGGGALVGVREWFGEYEYAVWPWAEDELADSEPETVADATSINFEAVANANPDLIVGVSSGMTQEDYETLSEIAPTLPQSDEWVDYGVPWQDQTLVIGQAMGREDEANRLISDLEEEFAATREEYPQLEGATIAVIGAGAGLFYFYTDADRSTSFFTALGMEVDEEAASLAGDSENFSVEISQEELASVGGADVLVVFASTPQDEEDLRALEVFSSLPNVSEDRAIYLSDPEDENYGALSFNTVLSTPVLLENLAPEAAEMAERA